MISAGGGQKKLKKKEKKKVVGWGGECRSERARGKGGRGGARRGQRKPPGCERKWGPRSVKTERWGRRVWGEWLGYIRPASIL